MLRGYGRQGPQPQGITLSSASTYRKDAMAKSWIFALILLAATLATGQSLFPSSSDVGSQRKQKSDDRRGKIADERRGDRNRKRSRGPKPSGGGEEDAPAPYDYAAIAAGALVGALTLLGMALGGRGGKAASTDAVEQQPQLGAASSGDDEDDVGGARIAKKKAGPREADQPGEKYEDFLEFLQTPSKRKLVVN